VTPSRLNTSASTSVRQSRTHKLRSTPKDIINKLNREINAAVADASIKKRFDDLDCTIIAGGSCKADHG
jgi:hypothetical protein